MIPQLYEKFQHWSNGGSVWIYSDPHFDDADIKLIDSDWPAHEQVVRNINAKVSKSDTLIILGDIGNPEYVAQIKAKYKILIAGNHDKNPITYKPYFNEVYGGPLFIGQKILLSHEPLDINCALNIHGHTHCVKGGLWDLNHFNVCSNCIGYTPINLGELIKKGYLAKIDDIHRITLENRKKEKDNEKSES